MADSLTPSLMCYTDNSLRNTSLDAIVPDPSTNTRAPKLSLADVRLRDYFLGCEPLFNDLNDLREKASVFND
jgi:hypothetical protein